jgi:hypothetical protein
MRDPVAGISFQIDAQFADAFNEVPQRDHSEILGWTLEAYSGRPFLLVPEGRLDSTLPSLRDTMLCIHCRNCPELPKPRLQMANTEEYRAGVRTDW